MSLLARAWLSRRHRISEPPNAVVSWRSSTILPHPALYLGDRRLFAYAKYRIRVGCIRLNAPRTIQRAPHDGVALWRAQDPPSYYSCKYIGSTNREYVYLSKYNIEQYRISEAWICSRMKWQIIEFGIDKEGTKSWWIGREGGVFFPAQKCWTGIAQDR